MRTVISTLPVEQPAGLKGARIIPRQEDGIPVRGLASLMLMEEQPSTGMYDKVMKTRHPIDGVGGTAELTAGGGLRLHGWSTVKGPTINFDEPYTIAMTGTRALPAQDKSYRLLIVGGIDLAGYAARDQRGATDPSTTGSLSNLYMNRSIDGPTQTGATASMPWPLTARWDRCSTLIFRHHGGGNIDIIQMRGDDVSLLNVQWPLDEMKGANGDIVMQRVWFGAHDTYFNDGYLTIDVAAIWHTALEIEELTVHAAAAEAIAAERGRT